MPNGKYPINAETFNLKIENICTMQISYLNVNSKREERERNAYCLFLNRIWSLAIDTISPEYSPIDRPQFVGTTGHVSADMREPIVPKFIMCV